MAAERGAEGGRRAVAHPLGHLVKSFILALEQILGDGHPQASRYSIGGIATARMKRSKNAERDSAAAFASCATVQERAGSPCMARIAIASRASLNPRSSPADASSVSVVRKASTSRTSTSRERTSSRPEHCSLASSIALIQTCARAR